MNKRHIEILENARRSARTEKQRDFVTDCGFQLADRGELTMHVLSKLRSIAAGAPQGQNYGGEDGEEFFEDFLDMEGPNDIA